MLRMDLVHVVRHKVLVEGRTQRAVARELGLSRTTVGKYMGQAAPARKAEAASRPRPVWDAIAERVQAVLADSVRWTGGKQRLTATRLHALLLAEGKRVGVTVVKEAVAEWKRQRREVFVPLTYRPGDLAEVDFFEVLVDVDGVRRKAWLFLMRLMYSGGSTSGRIKSVFSMATSGPLRISMACRRASPTTICGQRSCGSWSAVRAR
jgi:predicted transcriptional regulator